MTPIAMSTFLSYGYVYMAKSCSIGLYRISVRKAREQDSELDLNKEQLPGKQNFYEYFTSVLRKYETAHFKNGDTDDYLKLESIEITKHDEMYSIVQGRIESGDSGYASRLFDTEKSTSRTRRKEEAELFPYFFCLSETNDPMRAALCVQRFGKTGMFTNFSKCVRENFNKDFPGLVLQIDPFLPDFYIDKFITPKEVQEFRYTVLAPIGDATSLLLNNGIPNAEDMDVIIETRIKAKRKGRLRVPDSESTNVGEILSRILPKGIDQTKIVDKSITFVSADGQPRTFRTSRPDNNAMPYIEVEVKKDDNGHPAVEDVKGAVQRILVESKLY